jgi:hypothetical protein
MVRKILRKILWSYVGTSHLTQCVSLNLTPSYVRSSVAVRPRKSYLLSGDRPHAHGARPWCGPRPRSERSRIADVCAWTGRPHRGAYRGALVAQATIRVLHTRGRRRYHPACQLSACEGAPKSILDFMIILWKDTHTEFLLRSRLRERPVQPGRGVALVSCLCLLPRAATVCAAPLSPKG